MDRQKDYTVIRSSRRTVSLEVRADLTILVRAPRGMPDKDIGRFVSEHEKWIERARLRTAERQLHRTSLELSSEEANKLRGEAWRVIPPIVEKYASMMNVKPRSVKITSARCRFGSCNTRGNICFSYRLMVYPVEAVEYVVVHELAHMIHPNHSREFYQTVAKFMPDFKEREKILKNS